MHSTDFIISFQFFTQHLCIFFRIRSKSKKNKKKQKQSQPVVDQQTQESTSTGILTIQSRLSISNQSLQQSSSTNTAQRSDDSSGGGTQITVEDILKRKRSAEKVLESESCNASNTQTDLSSENIETDENSDEIADEEENDQKRQIWTLEAKFKNENELNNYLKANGEWATRGSDKKTGKIRWRCCFVKSKGPQCASKKYSVSVFEKRTEIDENAGSDEELCEVIHLYKTTDEHNHNNLPNKVKRLSEPIKKRNIDMHLQKRKPMTISLTIGDDESVPDDEQPTKRQIKNVVDTYKKKIFGSNPITMRELTEFVEARQNLPQDEDEAFILGFERSPSNQATDKFFRFFVTTLRLMRNADRARLIHTDATEKIMVEKNYLLIIGTTDMQRKFHLIGITLSSNQDADSYSFVFNCFKNGMHRLLNVNIDPDFVVADGDAAIALAAKRIFNKPVITCFVHVLRNVMTKYKFQDRQNNKNAFVADIRLLQKATNENDFEQGVQLFIKKWKNNEPEIVRKLERSFLNQHKNWYIGAGKCVPKDNNSVENFNGQLKKYSTEYLRKPLKQYIFDLITTVRQRSKMYRQNKLEPFARKVQISSHMMKSGYDYNLRNYVPLGPDENGIVDFYIFSSTVEGNITNEHVDKFLSEKYRSFDIFTEKAFRMWKVSFPRNINDWMDATCTCPVFDLHYMCKHVIAIAIDLEALPAKEDEEENYDDEPLFSTVLGRPKAVKPGSALQKE